MTISNTPAASIGQKLAQEAMAEHRVSEKALPLTTGAELGLAKTEKSDSDTMESFAASMDTSRLSAAALARYRTFAGSKAADERPQQFGEKKESFSHKSYMISEASRIAEQERQKETSGGVKEKDTAEAGPVDANAKSPQRKSVSGNESIDTRFEDGARAGNQPDDSARELQAKIKEVQRSLAEAQSRLSEASVKMDSLAAPDGASAEASDEAAAANRTQMTVAQAQAASAESEVNALTQELMQLYQELMAAMDKKS